MPAARHDWLANIFKNSSLIALSLITLPQDTFFLASSLVANVLIRDEVTKRRRLIRGTSTPYFEPKTILVTGVGMSKGLALARQFYAAGHNVIGADFEPYGALNPGRVSGSIRTFYSLTAPSAEHGSSRYIQSLLDIITHENVHLWVSCSGVASAVEDGAAKETIERLTSCRAIQFDISTTQTLHEKHSFIEHTASLGLNVPETHTVTSLDTALDILRRAQGTKQFILKSLVLDDAARGNMTLLPRPSWPETEEHLRTLRISVQTPWILQQYIHGPEYCTHTLVVRGSVRAFVACPSSDLLMHYEALPRESPLAQGMLDFTRKFAERQGETFTGHLSFDFLVREEDVREMEGRGGAAGSEVKLWPIECNPRAHTAVVLFRENPNMIAEYMDVLDGSKDAFTRLQQEKTIKANGASFTNGGMENPIIWPEQPQKYYWSGHDLMTSVLLPLISFLTSFATGKGDTLSAVLDDSSVFLKHLLFWKDGTFEIWDPWPWWWLYHWKEME
ncbi:MAG: hypothetical protein Q9165_001667 [Trypethelium subeluteriae]